MSHDTLVYLAKTLGPIWMMGFFLIVAIRAYNPKRRAEQDRIARSILTDTPEEDRHER
ncbi:cbb3-type cytochrome oxidase subunit 3 [Thalassorhabdomicrobium marinisediminis]|uniref:CcoQ/FixQ family Cbb3-type cytochrome c oxidase assembly chaperone n=1 Tax=Thalassorhabdomicrobium marinisediminis TaxID=2170577 RepID=A0A2T7FV50_9RHOB|nr:cbb3-type cytochrome c oxidase subunit 3 [Thalassorhabdomicrobium marinisediminis]PVA06041.1 hypothetical protein DC363_12035 [Thalassorhabdomicrobium marinisediminis]